MNELQPPKETLRACRIFFIAIVSGTIFFSIMVIIINIMQETLPQEIKRIENIFFIVAAAITLLFLIAARSGYARSLTITKDSLIPLADKLNQYRTALVRYIALCEGPSLFGIILFFLTGNYYFFIITAIMIVAMLSKAPTRKRVADDLGLDHKQQQELE